MKRFEALNGAAGVMMLATVGYLFVHSAQQDDTRADDRTQIQANGKKADAASATAIQAQTDAAKAIEAVRMANRRLKAAGKPQVPVPTIQPPVSPEDHPAGLTAEQLAVVRSLVVTEVASQHATLTEVELNQISRTVVALIPKPKDGVTPTDAQLQARVVAALAAFCVGDKCVAKPGPTGPSGPSGTNGKDAPAVTDEQLLASAKLALEAYCSLDSKPCKGDPGVAGPPGEDAAPPYSISDMDCVGDDTASVWRIYLSNGTDQKTFDRPGPCRIGLDPH